MSEFKRCPKGHYYQGEHCPYCKKNHFPVYCRQGQEYSYYQGTTKESIPICPQCGRLVRKEIPKPNWPIVGSVNNAYDGIVPWNYRWEGTCEHCGHDFGLLLYQDLGRKKIRKIIVRVASKQVETDVDSVAGLSGVEIIQASVPEHSIFVSTNELKCLIDALKDSPLLEQLDWKEDYT